MNRGDVVIVNFQPTAPTARTRPALVVQNDRDNIGSLSKATMQEIDACLKTALGIA